ncbi:hypothetical protein [Nitrososphaera sp. AFS]|uniref:hypothetical protein n=1 Tax=Nitrososphaera sp. AFS TaxID=2301191 RepID=UPI00139227DA|nr:hypothetical protein [Nitrososphaera sp. AFS]NAL77293.1 hypothetical protein [Nitrososphaera sp. AFS]
MSVENQYYPCLVCGALGVEKYSETLPDGAVLIKVIHDNGQFCEFQEYKSVDSFLQRKKNKVKSKIISHCPVCGKPGRINSYRPDKSRKNFKWAFYVDHERVQGYWGKKTKIRKIRRCYMKTEDQENAKKELGMTQ